MKKLSLILSLPLPIGLLAQSSADLAEAVPVTIRTDASTDVINIKGTYKELWNGPDGGKTFWCEASDKHCCTVYKDRNRTPQRPTTIVATDPNGKTITFDLVSHTTKQEPRGTQVLMKDAVIVP